MVLNYIWFGFFALGFLIALCKLIFLGDANVFPDMVKAVGDTSKSAFELALGLTGAMCFWLGIMKVGEKGGAINYLSKAISPFFRRLFPDVPKDHPAMGSIIMNYSANMLGLDNAATPLGLKAMEQLQEINPNKDTASNSMIMFMTLNTAGFTIIPVTILALRTEAGSINPFSIFIPLLIATYGTMLSGMIMVSIWQRIKWDMVLLSGVTALVCLLAGTAASFIYYPDQARILFNVIGPLVIFSIIVSFLSLAFFRKLDVYDSFITGAKEGFGVVINILPYLVAMLVAISIFRSSGGMDLLMNSVKWIFDNSGINSEFVDALPVGLMKPFSGSGARGLMAEIYQNKNFGPDSIVGYIATLMNGSHDTTFYMIALYFGRVAITKTRYIVATGLLTDLVSIILSIILAYIFFG